MAEINLNLKAVIFQEKSDDEIWWVAQCLEFDIAGQAKHMRDAVEELSRMVAVQICASQQNGLEPLKNLPRAPHKFWMMFDEGMRVEAKPRTGMPQSLRRLETETRVCA